MNYLCAYFCDSSVDDTLNESRQLDLLFETMLQQRVLHNNSAKNSSDDLGTRNITSRNNHDGYFMDYDTDYLSSNENLKTVSRIAQINNNISEVDWKGRGVLIYICIFMH
jgi:hypothetical protein